MNLFFLLIMSILHVFYIFVLLDREKKTSFFLEKSFGKFCRIKKKHYLCIAIEREKATIKTKNLMVR